MHMPSIPSGSIATVASEAGNASPQLSVRSTATGSGTLLATEENEQINLQIFVPELQIQVSFQLSWVSPKLSVFLLSRLFGPEQPLALNVH